MSTPARILPFSEDASAPTFSVAAHRLVFDRYRVTPHIWRVLHPQSGQDKDQAAARILVSTQMDCCAEYSPDGRRIVFASNRSGRDEIWVAAEDGSDLRMLTSIGSVESPKWSPDGNSIVFARSGKIHTVDSRGGTAKEVALEQPMKASSPSYSHDGQWLYFVSNISGRSEVWRIPTGGGVANRITSTGGNQPLESLDGETLWFVKADASGSSLWRADTRGGSEQQVVLSASARPLRFTVAERGVYFIRYELPDDPVGIDFLDFRTGSVKRVLTTNLAQRQSYVGLSFSPDGKWFLCAGRDFEDDLMQFENFR
jgi:eukaryotic-like serine/threonine-protein kinase